MISENNFLQPDSGAAHVLMKNKELYLTYLKDRYNEELARFDLTENKCQKFLGAITILLGVMTSAVGWGNDILLNPDTPIAWAIVVLIFLAFFAMVWALVFAMSALEIRPFSAVPKKDETLKLFHGKIENDCFIDELIQAYQLVLPSFAEDMKKKTDDIKKMYEAIQITGVCMFFVFLYGFCKVVFA